MIPNRAVTVSRAGTEQVKPHAVEYAADLLHKADLPCGEIEASSIVIVAARLGLYVEDIIKQKVILAQLAPDRSKYGPSASYMDELEDVGPPRLRTRGRTPGDGRERRP